jgi:hypothetical protein
MNYDTGQAPNYAVPLVNFGALSGGGQPQQGQQPAGSSLGQAIGQWLQQWYAQNQQPQQPMNIVPPGAAPQGNPTSYGGLY